MKRTRLRQVNVARRRRLREAQFAAQAELCRTLPCCACGAWAPSVPHHVTSRGARGGDADTVPLCTSCHDRVHRLGARTFQERAGVDFQHELEAVRLQLKENAPCGS